MRKFLFQIVPKKTIVPLDHLNTDPYLLSPPPGKNYPLWEIVLWREGVFEVMHCDLGKGDDLNISHL